MYSAVLMLALTAGSETADFGRNRCNGCNGCSGYVGCSSYGGCHGGCYGGGHGGGLFHRRNHGCSNYGCSGYSYGCCGAVTYGCATSYGCTGGAVIVPMKKEMPKGEQVPVPKKETSAPATIVINLPADARLTIDGSATKSTTDRRTLVTPNLDVASTYTYSVQAEVVREGRTLTQVQNVTVRGGQVSTVQFQFNSQGVASR